MPRGDCKDNEERNPITKKCVKKCKEDQIRNPETFRCVSKTGQLGKAILRTVANAPQPQQVVQKSPQQKQQPIAVSPAFIFSSVIELKKPRGRIIVRGEIVANINKPHTVRILYDDKVQKEKQFYVLQDAVKLFHDSLNSYIEKGYTNINTAGNTLDEIENIIREHFVCKLQPQPPEHKKKTLKKPKVISIVKQKSNSYSAAKGVDVSTCENDSTIILFESLTDIDNNLIIQFEDKYCFDVNEIAEYMISNKQFLNPLNKQRLTDNDIKLLLKHKQLTKENKDGIQGLIDEELKSSHNLAAYYKNHKEQVESLLLLFLLVGALCLSDYSETFSDSQTALGIAFEAYNKLPNKIQKVFRTMTSNSPGMRFNLEYVAKNYNTICIHGLGFYILEIMLFNIFELGCQHIIPETMFYVPPGKRQAIFIYRAEVDKDNTINVYCENAPFDIFLHYMVRVGFSHVARGQLVYDAERMYGVGYKLSAVKQYVETHLWDDIEIAHTLKYQPFTKKYFPRILKNLEELSEKIK